MTAAALRRTVEGLGAEDFPAEVVDVLALLGQDLPGRAPSLRASRLSATPVATSSPQVWLLGSSLFSAELAGSLGLPFSYAHHFNTGHTLQAADAYRRALRPSPVLEAPRLMVSASVLVADSDEEAHYLAGPSRVMALSLRTGRPLGPIVSPEDAALVERTGADELMITGTAFDVATRVHTLEQVAARWPSDVVAA